MIDILIKSLTKLQLSFLQSALTKTLPVFNKPDETRILYFFEMLGDYIRVPRFYAQSYLGVDLKKPDLLVFKQRSGLSFHGNMQETPSRPQKTALRSIKESLTECYGGTVIMPPGSGKTNIAIKLSLDLGLKTVILVHTNDLISQWHQRIENFVLGGVKIGLIQESLCQTDDCDFVLASLPSFRTRKYDLERLKCGLLIVDEVHHIAAETFSKVMGIIPHYYSVGLTATPRRGDKQERMIELLVGPRCFFMDPPKNSKVQVNMITYNIGLQKEIQYSNGTIGLSSMITLLTKDYKRNDLIVKVIKLLYLKFPTRKGLLLSDRVCHLKTLRTDLDPAISTIITNKIHTEMTPKQRKRAKKNREEVKFEKFITLSTYKMFAEAIDFDGDFVILATPKAYVEQATGRIMRGKNLEHSPVIFDIVDPFSSFDWWRWTRYQFYKKRGFEIISLNEFQIFNEFNKATCLKRKRDN